MSETDLPAPCDDRTASRSSPASTSSAPPTRKHGTLGQSRRLFFIYGPRQFADGGYKSVIVRNFERIRRGEAPVVNGDGEQALDYVYVDDCVDGARRGWPSAEHDGLTLNVASGTAVPSTSSPRRCSTCRGSSLEPTPGPPDWTAGTRRWGATALAARAARLDGDDAARRRAAPRAGSALA